jgi:ADP-heptose:LPS heptosyltransferase
VGSVAGRLELDELAALVAGADLLLCGDTGVAHVGTAFGTPSVLLFGPVPPELWRPLVDVDRHVVLWHGVGRAPQQGDEPDPALTKIDPAEVLGAARGLLGS